MAFFIIFMHTSFDMVYYNQRTAVHADTLYSYYYVIPQSQYIVAPCPQRSDNFIKDVDIMSKEEKILELLKIFDKYAEYWKAKPKTSVT